MKLLRANFALLLAAAIQLSLSSRCLADPSFAAGIQTGTIQNPSILEASGIAASRMNSNVLWTQQDHGNGADIFAMTPAGTNLGTYSIIGATNSDWEDIAVGPGPVAGAQYLYVGDTGDNPPPDNASIAVYRVLEPVVSDTQSPVTTSISGAVKFTFVYPDGPHDAESLFVDPLTKDIYIITKQINPSVYRAAYPQLIGGTTTLTLAATFVNPNPLTAADISPDGSEIIVRGYPTTSGLLYQRPAGGTVADAFATTPISIPLVDQGFIGEAIGFDPNGWGYYTTSEGLNRPIHYFNRLPPPAGTMYWDNDGAAAATYVATGAGMGGTGTWNTSAQKWYNGSSDVAWVDGNNVVFWGTAGTMTLGAAQAVNSLAFKTNGYIVAGSTLTLSGSSVTVDAGVTATIDSIVAGTAGLVKNGAGTLVLTNSSNQTSGYTGGTTINAGTLNIASGTISHSGVAVAINNGSTLQFTGDFTLAAARAVTLGTGGGRIDTNGNSDTIAGVISGTSINKIGAGTLTLTNANLYTGGTTVSVGTLRVNNTSGSGTGTGAVSVASGAVLGGTGTIQGNVTNSGTVGPGNSPGTLHLDGTYSQSSGGKLEIELAPSGGHDELAVAGTATLAGTLSVLLTGGYVPHEDDAFQIVTAAGFGGSTFTTTSLPALSGGLDWNIDYGATAVTLAVVLHGDFNHDGLVDAADYVTWRKGPATEADYQTWRAHFGQNAGAGAAGVSFAAVPEPGSLFLLGFCVAMLYVRRCV